MVVLIRVLMLVVLDGDGFGDDGGGDDGRSASDDGSDGGGFY